MAYEVEVYGKNGTLLGDIRHLVSDLKWTKQRNYHETVEFTMDLSRYEEYIAKLNVQTPYDFMDVLSTDIRLRRNGVDFIGTNVIMMDYESVNPSVRVKVSSTGYLNYFKDQYIDIDYNNTPQGEILWGVVDQVQQLEGANFGITRGDHTSVNMLRDRHMERKNVKDFMIQMTNVQKGCDFEFKPNKQFNTYDAIGSFRPDVRLIYPENVASFAFSRRGDVLFNYIHGIGSGNGVDAIQAHAKDSPSMLQRYRRERIATFNSVVNEATLQENIDGIRDMSKDVRELPSFTVSDGVLDFNIISTGDTVYAELRNYRSFSHVKGNYRIEKIECEVDEQDSEMATLTFDDLSIDDIIAMQDEGNE